MENIMTRFGKKLRHHTLQSWQIGVLLASYNLALLVAMLLLILVTLNNIFWVYLLLVSPILLTVFWLCFTQQILYYYHEVAIHDALIVAKVGATPLVAVFLFFAIALGVGTPGPDVPEWWTVASYYGTIFGVGSIFLQITVVVFGLRHRLHLKVAR